MPVLTRYFVRGAAAVMVAALPLVGGAAQAATCTLSANAMAFGNYNGVTKTVINTTTTFKQTCTGNGSVSYSITANGGQSNNVSARALASGTNRLNYQIYTNSGRTTVFGGSGGTFSANAANATAATVTFTVYGTVFANQAAVPGTYSDSLTLTVTY